MKTYTRQQYLNQEVSHQDYYAQYVTEEILARVKGRIGEKTIKESTDPHFNDIPLQTWDKMSPFGREEFDLKKKLKENGDFFTLSAMVCIGKAAARIIKETK